MRLVRLIQVLEQHRKSKKAKIKKQQDSMKMTTFTTKLLTMTET